MIEEYTLEDDMHHEFKGGSLRIHSNLLKTPENPSKSLDNPESGADKDNTKINPNSQWGQTFMSPFTSLPSKISLNLWSNKSEIETEKTPSVSVPSTTTTTTAAPATITTSFCNQRPSKTVQPAINIPDDPNNFFTFRDGVVENAVKECKAEFLDEESDGPLLAYFLLTQINHWDTDKERLVLLTPKTLVTVKYDFIALKRLGYKKLPLELIEQLYIGDLVYPNGSVIPRLNGIADGISHLLETCMFNRWSSSETKQMNNFYQARDRNMRGMRLLWKQEKQFNTKWNPFFDNVPFCTFTFHPLYFHKDCTDETRKNMYDLDLFIDKLCDALTEDERKKGTNSTCAIYRKNIILENYVGLGSLIHNRNALGFFKVRGKFSF